MLQWLLFSAFCWLSFFFFSFAEMKIVFIFAFIVACGLVFCEQEKIEDETKVKNVEDPTKNPLCR